MRIHELGKRLGVALCLGFGLHGALSAEDPPAPKTPSTYFETLRLKLDHVARRANQPSAGSANVIGLRGSKQESLSKQLYWRGTLEEVAVSPDEIREFRMAIEKASGAEPSEGIPALEAFIAKYPKSAMLPDAEESLRQLNPSR